MFTVENGCNQAADDRADPVDPVISRVSVSDHGRAKSSSGVHAAASPERAEKLACKEGQADADGCHKSRLVLLGRQPDIRVSIPQATFRDSLHKNGEYQKSSEECLEKDSLNVVHPGRQSCDGVAWTSR